MALGGPSIHQVAIHLEPCLQLRLLDAWPDGHAETFEGRITGQLTWPPRGTLGFGYDPMFIPEGHAITFGEMRPAQKHAMSHRARAFAKFVEACLG